MGGYVLEQWDGSSLVSSFTFDPGTVLSPDGTATIRIGSGTAANDPANYYYNGRTVSGTFGSATAGGKIFIDPSGNIVDAVAYPGSSTYTFPAASGVTTEHWDGNIPAANGTAGIRLEGPYTKDATNWIVSSAAHTQDPNDVNADVTVPSTAAISGFTWSLDGVVTSENNPDTIVGPFTIDGVYQYVATYNSPCGIFTDTAHVHVHIPQNDLAVIDIVAPDTDFCHDADEDVTVLITNLGIADVTTAFDLSYTIDGGAPVTETVNVTVPSLDTISYTFTTPINFGTLQEDTTFYLTVYADLTGDPFQDNDTLSIERTFLYIPADPVAVNDTVPYGAPAFLTASSNAEIYWYDDALGTNQVHVGDTFMVDSVFADISYFARAVSGSSENVGKYIYDGTANTSGSQWGLVFDVVNNDVVIQSVDVFSVGAGGQMDIQLRDDSGNLITDVGTFTYPSGSTSSPVRVTFPLELEVPVGTGYRIVSDNMSGNLIRETSGNTFPYISPSGNVIIESGFITNPGSNTYYWFYNWQVGVPGCESSQLVEVEAIVETPICYYVSNVATSNITQDEVMISWTPGGTESEWEIEYGPAGFTPGTGTVEMAYSSNETIYGLMHSTHYEFYVRAFCDPNYSAWNGPHSFTTDCGIFLLPFEENFDGVDQGDMPLCWNATHTNWSVNNSDNAGGNIPEMRLNWTPSVTDTVGFMTPPINTIVASSLYLSFKHAVDDFSGGYTLAVVASTDGFATFTDVWYIEPTGNVAAEEVIVDISAFAGLPALQLAWVYLGNTSDINYWYVDDIIIDQIPACNEPVNLAAQNVEPHSADLAWTGSSETSWQIEWDVEGFVQGSGNLLTTSDNPYHLSGLTPETDYEFYVRAICMFDTTTWAGPHSFSTPATCPVVDSLIAGNITQTSVDIFLLPLDTFILFEIEWDTTGFTQGDGYFIVTSDLPYTLSSLDPAATYDIYVRIICDTVLGDTSHWAGPLTVTTLDPCYEPTNLNVVEVGLDFAELEWTAGGTETLWQIHYDTVGFTPGDGHTVNTSDNPHILTGLDENTHYEFYVRAVCDTVTNDMSAWVGPEAFSTLGVGIADLSHKLDLDIYPNPNNGIFNIYVAFDAEKLSLTVINLQGQIVHEEQLQGLTHGSVNEINFSNLAAGVYNLRINDGVHTSNHKLIIK